MIDRRGFIKGVCATLLAKDALAWDFLSKSRAVPGREALYYDRIADGKNSVVCRLCPRRCRLSNGELSFCRARKNIDGTLYALGFGLACAKAGATSVLGLDQSEDAIAAARAAAERNGLSASFEVANVFDWFTEHREASFDLIVLDPPPFARSKDAVDGALRGYKELNLRALRLLAPGGILATYSCSHRVSEEMYLEVIEDAASDARREAVVLERTSQPADHPVLLNFPESRYLKGFIIEIRA